MSHAQVILCSGLPCCALSSTSCRWRQTARCAHPIYESATLDAASYCHPSAAECEGRDESERARLTRKRVESDVSGGRVRLPPKGWDAVAPQSAARARHSSPQQARCHIHQVATLLQCLGSAVSAICVGRIGANLWKEQSGTACSDGNPGPLGRMRTGRGQSGVGSALLPHDVPLGVPRRLVGPTSDGASLWKSTAICHARCLIGSCAEVVKYSDSGSSGPAIGITSRCHRPTGPNRNRCTSTSFTPAPTRFNVMPCSWRRSARLAGHPSHTGDRRAQSISPERWRPPAAQGSEPHPIFPSLIDAQPSDACLTVLL